MPQNMSISKSDSTIESQDNKVGHYAISTIKTQPWLTTSITQTSSKIRKSKNTNTVIFPIFLECAQLTTDPFWISFFTSASYGKFPRGFLYKDGYITYKKGNKMQQLEIPSSPIEALPVCMTFFSSMAGIMSQMDQVKARQDYDNTSMEFPSLHNCTWMDIKKKKIKEMLINIYVDDLVQQYHLNDDQKNKVKSLINVGFILEYFSPQNIQFTNGRIQNIIGLEYNSSDKTFYINNAYLSKLPDQRKKKRDDESSEKKKVKDKKAPSFLRLWVKYLDSLKKKTRYSDIKHNPLFRSNSFSLNYLENPTVNTSDLSTNTITPQLSSD